MKKYVFATALLFILISSTALAQSTLATDCTLYASPSGSNSNTGTSPLGPKTFDGAGSAAQPGDIVCIMGGTYNRTGSYYLPRGGTSGAWIVYKAYGDSPVNFVYTGSASNWTAFFYIGGPNSVFPNAPSYLEFNGFNFDGRDNAVDAFICRGGHHLRIRNNVMKNFGAAGISTNKCDYITAENNLIHHAGYGEGWASGITLNSNQWFDNYQGFHNIVANNAISASYDNSVNHTDGNGIIMDLGGNTPPVLVVNNVIYGNGGRCIQALNNQNFWFVNNTCYKNGLDTAAVFGGIVAQGASNGYIINNISYGWNGRPPYDQLGTNTNIQYFDNMYYGAANRNVSNPEVFQADPLFINAPLFHPTNPGQYATALAPWLLGNGLVLLPISPALGRGIDPSSLPNLSSAIATDLRRYIYNDVSGVARPQGGPFDLGAYQVSAVTQPPTAPCPPSPPSYPAGMWDRVWCDNNFTSKFADVPDEASEQFDTNWGTGAGGIVGGISADNIGFRSGRTISIANGGDYTFTVGSDDGVRVWIDGTLVLDRWMTRAYTTDTFTRTLSAGPHQVRMDYYEGLQSARVSFSYAVVPPPQDTTPPTVSISTPLAGISISGIFNISVAASDNVGVTRTELYVDGVLKGTDTVSPYSFPLNTTLLTDGAHTLFARAYDTSGNQAASNGVSAVISNILPPPPAGCVNPTPLPLGFSAPCPLLSISAPSVSRSSGSLGITATPLTGQAVYIYTTVYVLNGGMWQPHTLSGASQYPGWSTATASLTLSGPALSNLTLGSHLIASWDWTWNGACYTGPGSAVCNQGSWRVQAVNVQ